MSKWNGKRSPWLELLKKERERKYIKNKHLLEEKAKLAREAELIRKSIPPNTILVKARKPTKDAPIDESEEKEKDIPAEEYVWNLVGGVVDRALHPVPEDQAYQKKRRRKHLKLGKGIVEQIE